MYSVMYTFTQKSPHVTQSPTVGSIVLLKGTSKAVFISWILGVREFLKCHIFFADDAKFSFYSDDFKISMNTKGTGLS